VEKILSDDLENWFSCGDFLVNQVDSRCKHRKDCDLLRDNKDLSSWFSCMVDKELLWQRLDGAFVRYAYKILHRRLDIDPQKLSESCQPKLDEYPERILRVVLDCLYHVWLWFNEGRIRVHILIYYSSLHNLIAPGFQTGLEESMTLAIKEYTDRIIERWENLTLTTNTFHSLV